MHRATASLTEIPLSATPSKPKKPRFSVISTMTPTISSKNISTKKIMPFDPIPAENSITNSPQIYAKSEQNTPMKLYILNSGLFKTKRVYDFSICSQLKEMSSSINFPCIKEAPVVSQFPEDDSLVSEACDSSRSLPIKSPSYNETQAKITSPLLCRICLDHENAEDFIFPCRCNGSQKYVHQTCLKLWLLHSTREEMELTTCELCKCPLKMFFHYSTKCNPCADGKSNLAWSALIIGLITMFGVLLIFYYLANGDLPDDLTFIIIGAILAMLSCFCYLLSIASMLETCLDRKVTEWIIESQDL